MDIEERKAIKAANLARFACKGCGKITDSYMVHAKVWSAAALRHNDNACLVCLEKFLERNLTMHDFTPAPINNPIRFGYLLRMREEKEAREATAKEA